MKERIEGSDLFSVVKEATVAIRNTSITHCEMLLARTFIKRSDPLEKVNELIATHSQELAVKSLATVICPFLWGYIQDKKAGK